MSLNLKKLEPICVRDPRTMVTEKQDYAVLKGGSQVSFKQYTTTSISNSSLQYSCPPPSADIFVDRKIYHYVPVRLTFQGVPAIGQTLLNFGEDAPRQYGLTQSVDTMNMTVNNFAVSVNSADIAAALLRYNVDNLLKDHEYSISPSYPDQSQLYSDLRGDNRNPLTGYGDSTDESNNSRAGFGNMIIVSNPASSDGTSTITAQVDVAFCEPLFLLSPAYWGCRESHPFVHVNTIDFNVTFLNQAVNRMWSRFETATPLTSFTYAIGGLTNGPTSFQSGLGNQPLMLFCYITPQETQVIPRDMITTYPYFDIQRFPTDIGAIAPCAALQVVSNNVQLSSIPRRIYVYARQRNQDLYSSPTNTDSFMRIDGANIQYMNQTGSIDIVRIRYNYMKCQRKNGCSLSWTQWSGGPVQKTGSLALGQTFGTVGSVLCINMAEDIGLGSLLAPGKIEHNTLQITVNIRNTGSTSKNITLYVVVVNEGVFNIGPGVGQACGQIGVLSSQDILDCNSKPFLNYQDIKEVNGGDFLSGIKDFFGKANQFLKDNKVISTILKSFPITAPFAPLAKNFGYGVRAGGVQAGVQAGDMGMMGYGDGVLIDGYGDGVLMDSDDEGGEGEGVYAGGARMSKRKLKHHSKRRIIL